MTMTLDQLTDAILAGAYDENIEKLSAAVAARASTKRTTQKADDFGIGDKVRFNSLCGTKYLHGQTATVTGRGRTKLIVQLDKPVGRFLRLDNGIAMSVDVKVPPSIIDKVA